MVLQLRNPYFYRHRPPYFPYAGAQEPPATTAAEARPYGSLRTWRFVCPYPLRLYSN